MYTKARNLLIILVLVLFLMNISCSQKNTPTGKTHQQDPVNIEKRARDLGGYTFYFNGEPIEPIILSIDGTPLEPREGDVAVIGDLFFTIDKPGVYKFKGYADQRFVLENSDGSETVVGAYIGMNSQRGVVINPLDRMSDNEISKLRGICIDTPAEGLSEKLSKLNPDIACVTVTDKAADDTLGFPKMPENIKYVILFEGSKEGMSNYNNIKRLKDLRLLFVKKRNSPFDLELLKDCDELAYLNLNGIDSRNTKFLSNLVSIRFLSLSSSSDLDNIEFVKKMPELRVLDILGTQVTDLSPIAGLKKLIYVNASKTKVKKLPAKKVDKLEKIEILSCPVDKKDLNEFMILNPKTRVEHSWEDALKNNVKDADRIVVRTGGICHRDPKKEKILLDEEGADKAKELVSMIKINEKSSGIRGLDCGTHTIEFYKGDTFITAVSIHQGSALRWIQSWPGDALLTAKSSDNICKWLSDHGIKEPLTDKEKVDRKVAAAKEKTEKFKKLLPAEVIAELKTAKTDKETIKAFEKNIKDEQKRAILYLKLYGIGNGSWNIYTELDSFVSKKLLPTVSDKMLSKVVKENSDDPEVASGALRWIFGDGQYIKLDKEAEAKVLEVLAPKGLESTRQINRRRTMTALERIDSQISIELLRKVMNEEIKAKEPRPDELEDAVGFSMMSPSDMGVPEKCSDITFAAVSLARAGDKESAQKISEILKKSSGEDKTALEKAYQSLKVK